MTRKKPDSRHLLIASRRLHYLEWNPAGKRTLVLLHGGGLTARTWEPMCGCLDRDLRCLALDLRGHGDSEWSYDHAYELSHFSADVKAFLAALDLEQFHLVGMSLGGIVAMDLASRHLPGLCSLIVVDVIPGVASDAPHRITQFFRSLEARITNARSLDQVVEWYSTQAPAKPLRVIRHLVEANVRRRWDGTLAPRYHADGIHNVDSHVRSLACLRNRSRRITCPTLVVKGALSRTFSGADLQAFVATLPDGSSTIVDGAGHAVQEDQPARLGRAITAFVKRTG